MAKIVEQNSDDFAARSQLRLLRVLRSLRKPDIQVELACVIITGKPAEDMLYKFLGFEKKRLSLLDWCDGESSPLCMAQHRLLCLMQHFDEVAERDWELLTALGADMGVETVRLHARRECLQLSAGLFEIFEIRMSKPPYSWLQLVLPSVPVAAKAQLARQSFEEPRECMPMFCKRLLQRYPSPADLMTHAPAVLETWARECILSIAHSERANALFRRACHSDTQGSSATYASNRVACQQLRAAFLDRGGKDPLKKPLVDKVAEPTSKSKRTGVGGSAFLSFYNAKMRAFKQLRSPRRPMTDALRAEAHEAIGREWAEVKEDPERYRVWLELKRQGGSAALIADRGQHEAQIAFRPLWGLSDDQHIVSRSRLAGWHAHIQERDGDPMAIGDGDGGGGQALVVAEGQRQLVGTRAADLAWRNEALIIKALVPQRAQCAPAASANLLFGCYSDPKNVCKHCTTQEEWARLEQFRNLLNRFCDHLGADRARSGDEVIMLMTQDGQRAMILVLVFAKMQPKMQLFARCLVGDSLIIPLPAAFPFEAVLASRRTRLAVALPDCRWMAIDIRTSDEIMLEAVRLAWPWKVRSLKTRICCDRPSLMWLIAEGAGDDFVQRWPAAAAPEQRALRTPPSPPWTWTWTA